MGHIEGASRAQHILFPEGLDDYMVEDNPARFIDAFVDSLALGARGFRRTRPAATGRPAADVGHNAQVAVDAKHHLFVVQDVTNAVTDVDQLSGIAIQAKEALEVEPLTVVAAMGYYYGEEINACEAAGIEPYVAKPLTSANRKLGLLGKERRTDDPA